jgi:signal transduction histidine kinase/DNA-binding response OmpR family regulator/CHASE3 domain sensor protein
MKSNFKRNIIIGFGVSLLLLLVSSIASYISIKNLISSARWVDRTGNVISELENVSALLIEAETNQRGYLLTSNNDFLEPFQANKILIREQIAGIKVLTIDNAPQQQFIEKLNKAVDLRLEALSTGIRIKQEGQNVTNTFLLRGKEYMGQSQNIIDEMEKEERKLLVVRTENMQQFSIYTPLVIIFASVISLVITIFFGLRIVKDYQKREKLQDELIRKDADISKRIDIIQRLADKISSGNYTIRIDDEGKDVLGELSVSLNKMAESLDYSFVLLSEKEWLQAGIASLNEKMLGEKDTRTLTDNILHFIVEYTNSKVGAFYLLDDSRQLHLISSYALSANVNKEVSLGEGIVGQCATNKKTIKLEELPAKDFTISFATGNLIPASVVAIPVQKDGKLFGVIELGSLNLYTSHDILFLETVSEQSAIAINGAQNRRKLQELLEKTQSQSEELQFQHNELENINEELKSQSQKLQVSEEELKVQQEELMQTNTELEERTNLLEERNQMIEERNQEIQLKARELETTTRYKSEFLANMSHELRTPLNSILLLSRLMAENSEQNLSIDQIGYAQVIQTSGQGLLSLIDEILDLSKVESGKMDVELREIAVKEITNDLRSLFAPLAKEKGIDLIIDVSDETPVYMDTDKMRLEQILRNLISNALKFTARGSVRLEVSQQGEGMLSFSVRDTGIGIPQDKQKLVFGAFQQADGSTRRQYGGTGLGLSISRELAKLLGGKIELKSEPGNGSEFRLIIPVSNRSYRQTGSQQDVSYLPVTQLPEIKGNDLLVTQDDTADKMSEVFQRIEHGLKNEPRKVLIVEENSKHAKALYYFLENFNIEPEIKNNVNETISALSAKDGTCVILDIGMSDGQLHEALQKIKGTPGLELLPIIIFTGKNLSKMEEGRIKQYANSVVMKTAHSYQRILDEVSLYLHLVEGNKGKNVISGTYKKLGRLTEVLKNKKVLIADDDVRNIFSLSKALESIGMTILSAVDGKEALQQVKDDPSIDVVLMDMMMPELDGYDTMRAIRQMPKFKKLPIIAVTAKAMAGDREKCISAGASDYITKPIDKDQLLSLLRVWLYDKH